MSSSIQRLWVFSDLHLSDPSDPLYSSFLKVLDEPNHEQDAVVFNGDIFELFVGNSHFFSQKHSQFYKKLTKLSQKNVKLFYIQGNHDFLLTDAFPDVSIQILDSELILNNIYIAHGDLVDIHDRSYLMMRNIFRSKPFSIFIDSLPGMIIEKIGQSFARSYEQKGNVNPNVRQVFRAFAEEKKRQGFDFVILGHSHDFDDVKPFYFNMGYPPVHRQYLFYSSESNSFERRVFPRN